MATGIDPSVVVATCGGLGWSPWAPGTVGAAAGLPLAVATGSVANLLARQTSGPDGASLPWEAGLAIGICLAGIPICGRAARALGSHDPGPVVFDELAAMPLCLLAVPPAQRTWSVLAAAFVLFRIFDICKPPPCNLLERLPNGLGIMADDWAAAGYVAAALWLARSWGWL